MRNGNIPGKDILNVERVGKEALTLLSPWTQRGLVFMAVADVVVLCVMYFGLYDFKMSDWNTDQINQYDVGNSVFDIFIVGLFRCLCALVCVVAFNFYYVAYYVQVVSLFLLLGKAIVFTSWNDGGLTGLLILSTCFCLAEGYFIMKVRDLALQPVDSVTEAEKSKISVMQFAVILKPYFWPHGDLPRFQVILTWGLLIGSKICVIFAPLYIGRAASKLEVGGKFPVKPIVIYATLGFLSTMLRELHKVTYQTVKQTAFAQLSEYTFRHMHGLSLDWHLQKKMGNVLRSMDRGVGSADTVVTYLFLYLLPSFGECIAVFIIFYTVYDVPWLTSIAFLCIAAYTAATVKITMWRKKFRAATNKHDNDYHDKLTDSLINYETVKYFANEEYEVERYTASVKKFQKYSLSTQMSLSLLNTSQSFIMRFCVGACLVVTAYEIFEGRMDLGDFVSINVYLLQLFSPLQFLGSVYNAIIQAFVDMENLSELLAVDQDVKDRAGAIDIKPKIQNKGVKLEFKDVSFKYPTQAEGQGLKNVSFVVEPDTTTAIVGSTGAGKTTIGRLLFRFYDTGAGSISIDGHDVADVTQVSLRKMVGVVPQDTVMFNDTLLHNVMYGDTTASPDQAKAAAKAAQILPFINRATKGWDTMVGERGLKLSGGEKQRVAIARCLLKNPPLVLLDEATSALDSKTEKEIQESLLKLGRSRTTLIIAHRLSTIKHADQILVMDDGRIAERGTHQELLAKRGLYFELWDVQQKELDPSLESKVSESDLAEDEQGDAASPVRIHFDDVEVEVDTATDAVVEESKTALPAESTIAEEEDEEAQEE